MISDMIFLEHGQEKYQQTALQVVKNGTRTDAVSPNFIFVMVWKSCSVKVYCRKTSSCFLFRQLEALVNDVVFFFPEQWSLSDGELILGQPILVSDYSSQDPERFLILEDLKQRVSVQPETMWLKRYQWGSPWLMFFLSGDEEQRPQATCGFWMVFCSCWYIDEYWECQSPWLKDTPKMDQLRPTPIGNWFRGLYSPICRGRSQSNGLSLVLQAWSQVQVKTYFYLVLVCFPVRSSCCHCWIWDTETRRHCKLLWGYDNKLRWVQWKQKKGCCDNLVPAWSTKFRIIVYKIIHRYPV